MYSAGEYVTLPTVIAHLSFVSIGNYIFVEGIEGREIRKRLMLRSCTVFVLITVVDYW